MSSDAAAPPPNMIGRTVLYEEVWSIPLRTLAKKYQISDVALGKICGRLNVPRPGVGHWVRIEHGAKIERPPLPPLVVGQLSEVTLAPWVASERRGRSKQTRGGREEPPVVEVPTTLAGGHSVALQLKRDLATRKPDPSYGGLLVIKGGPPTPIRVTQNCESRLLRVASALFKALELRGHRVVLDRQQYKSTITVQLAELKLAVGFHEHLTQVPHVSTREERASEQRGGYSWAPKSDFHGSGLIQVVVGESWRRAGGTWKERSNSPLEAQLGAIVLKIEQAAENLRARERANEEWRRRLAEAEEQRRQSELQSQHLRLLGQDLEQMSERADKAARIRTFLDAARRAMDAAEDSKTSRWLAWASAYADDLDPLRHPERIAKALTRPDLPDQSPSGQPPSRI